MSDIEPRWWTLRGARSLKPATYTCPICGRRLHATSDHVILFPEGGSAGRRHAHPQCVERARKAGRLPTKSEWRATQPPRPWWKRLLGD